MTLIVGALVLTGCTPTMDRPDDSTTTTVPPIVTTGTITGTVRAAGAGVGGAGIVFGARFTMTNSSGQFTFTEVAAGTHSLSLVTPPTFGLAAGETAAKSTTVTAGQTSTLDWAVVDTIPGPVPGPAPKTVEIAINASTFAPDDISVARGDTVRWVNMQPSAHTLTPDSRTQPGVWRAENVSPRTGPALSHTFDTTGTYSYSCTIHFGMRGVVRVQ